MLSHIWIDWISVYLAELHKVDDVEVKVIDYLNQHFDKPISLADVANLANMTEVSFSRFFKQHTGISFIDNLLEIRLGHASRLLIETHLPISQIAFNCGFNNISNFNRIFKKKKGSIINLELA
mgnify:CR=1 FL=1